MDIPLKIMVIGDEKPTREWLLNHTNTFEYVESGTPDVVILQLSSDAMNHFITQLQQHEQGQVTIGDLSIDLDGREVTIAGQVVHLTPTEYKLLRLLAKNHGQVVSREALMKVFNHSTHPEHLLHVHMSDLRRKIEPNPDEPCYILSVSSIGYRLKRVG